MKLHTIFEPSVSVVPIEMPLAKLSKTEQIGERRLLGYNPLIYYNGISILPEHIESFELNCDNFIPELHVIFTDRTEIMQSNAFSMDNTIISLYIDSRTKDIGTVAALRPIRMDFKISDYSYLNNSKSFYVQGVLNVDGLYLSDIRAYRDMTSYNVLSKVATTSKLGFTTNVSGTSDKMTWRNTDLKIYHFIQNITGNIYNTEKSFFTSFVDFYYSLNLVDVETQLTSDEKDHMGILTSTTTNVQENASMIAAPLYLINKDFSDSTYNNSFKEYTISNTSLKTSLRNGYRTELYYYDRFGNKKDLAGTFVKFVLETNTDGTGIVLKGVPSDTKPNGFFLSNTRKVYDSHVDTYNMHSNYNYAHWLNTINSEEIKKLEMTIKLTHPNFNFYKYQKISITIMDGKPDQNGNGIKNERLSGGWLITSIRFTFDLTAGLEQELVVVKRELSV